MNLLEYWLMSKTAEQSRGNRLLSFFDRKKRTAPQGRGRKLLNFSKRHKKKLIAGAVGLTGTVGAAHVGLGKWNEKKVADYKRAIQENTKDLDLYHNIIGNHGKAYLDLEEKKGKILSPFRDNFVDYRNSKRKSSDPKAWLPPEHYKERMSKAKKAMKDISKDIGPKLREISPEINKSKKQLSYLEEARNNLLQTLNSNTEKANINRYKNLANTIKGIFKKSR